jgi:hypothetical protein
MPRAPSIASGYDALNREAAFGAAGRGAGPCSHRSPFCKRRSVNVRFAPKATEVMRCRELARWSKTGPDVNCRHRPGRDTCSCAGRKDPEGFAWR